jgi:hypothetical protein
MRDAGALLRCGESACVSVPTTSVPILESDGAYVLTIVFTMDLVFIDQQSVGKRSLHLIDTQCEKEMDDHLLACQ